MTEDEGDAVGTTVVNALGVVVDSDDGTADGVAVGVAVDGTAVGLADGTEVGSVDGKAVV